jgi:MYXO-CTERM domain-containing protein
VSVRDKGVPPGGDHHSAPEPISLVTGLVGSGVLGLYALLRRRKDEPEEEELDEETPAA